LLAQLSKFAVIGFINTLVDFGVFNLLIILSGTQSPSSIALINSLAVCLAVANSYLLNQRWTFSLSNRKDVQLPRFILASLIGIVINSGIIMLFANLNVPGIISPYLFLNGAKIFASLISSAWNFLAYRNWVFRDDEVMPDFQKIPSVAGLISIIIPAFNEEKRLPQRLRQLAEQLPARLPIEIVVVNDGSRDNTLDVMSNFAQEYPFIKCMNHKKNLGKGAAVRTGMYNARGEYLIFTDADDTYTADHIEKVAKNLMAGREIVIACRKSRGRERIEGEAGWRNWQGKVFNLMVQLLLLPGVKDSQCGLKGFKRELAADLFPRQRIRGFAFDVELLSLARSLHLPITELPVSGIECDGSTVSHLLAPLSMAWDLIKIRLALGFNLYALPDLPSLPRQWALVSGIFVLALLARIPWLWEFPRYIDELKEVNLAYQIFQGQTLPLHNMAHDIGALHNYILAAIFKLMGTSIYWPRFYVAITSALTVVLIYHIGKKLYGHWVGITAALLLIGNGMHILVTHMAWSNCTTPFFFCLAFLALLKAEEKKSGGWLVLSAFLWALTLQTHSSVIIYVLVVLVYVLRPQFRQLTAIKSRYYLLASLTFVVGYANMLYYNLISRGGSFYWLKYKGYALEKHPGLTTYLHNLQEMLIELLRALSSTYQSQDSWGHYLANPWFSLALFLMLVGSFWAYQEKKSLPLYFLAGAFLLMPWINQRYVFFLATRYIMPLVLCALLIVSLGLVRIAEDLFALLGKKRILRLPAFSVLAGLMLLQLVPFYAYCADKSGTNQSNRLALQIFQKTIKISKPGASLVILDKNLQLENDPLPYLLTLAQQPYLVRNPSVLTFSGSNPENRKTPTLYNGNKLVGIMSAESFAALRPRLTPQEIDSYSCQLTMPASAHGERKVYVLDLGLVPQDNPYRVERKAPAISVQKNSPAGTANHAGR